MGAGAASLHVAAKLPGRRALPRSVRRSLAFACPCMAVLGSLVMIAEDEQGLNTCSSAADNMNTQACLVVELGGIEPREKNKKTGEKGGMGVGRVGRYVGRTPQKRPEYVGTLSPKMDGPTPQNVLRRISPQP